MHQMWRRNLYELRIKQFCYSYLHKQEIILIACNIYCIVFCIQIILNYGWKGRFEARTVCSNKIPLDAKLFSFVHLFSFFYSLFLNYIRNIRNVTFIVYLVKIQFCYLNLKKQQSNKVDNSNVFLFQSIRSKRSKHQI